MSAFDAAAQWLCDRGGCARQAKQVAVFAIGSLLLCDQDANENIDGIEIEGGVLFNIDLSSELFPGLHHFPAPKKVAGDHAERPTLSDTKCPKCNSAQTYARSESLTHACRACHHTWGPGNAPSNVTPMVSPLLRGKELEANASQRKELRKRIAVANYAYYMLEKPMMSDLEYDELKRQHDALLPKVLPDNEDGQAAA